MAIYHLSMRPCSRGKGQSIAGMTAYILGMRLRDQYTGKVHDRADRCDVLYRAVLLPPDAPVSFLDPQTLMDQVNLAERRYDARMGRTFDMAFPRELDQSSCVQLIREYAEANFTQSGLAVVIAVHAGIGKTHDRPGESETANPHAHLLVLSRPVNENGFLSTKTSTRRMDSKETLREWRKNWADSLNRELIQRGFQDRTVSPETLAKQGIDREPTIHMGAATMRLEEKGVRTERGKKYREILQRNREAQQREEERTKQKTRDREQSRLRSR